MPDEDHPKDDAAKVAEIEAKLMAISHGDDSPLAVGDPEPEKKEEAAPAADDVSAAEAELSQVSEATGESDEVEAKADASDDKPLSLPDNYTRSLIAAGWSADEITQQHEALGDEFVQIAEKVHENRKRESREWAAHGRIEASQRAAAEESTEQEQTKPPTELSRVDVEALKAEYGDDPRIAGIIDKLVGPTNKAIEAMNTMLPSVAESAERQAASEQQALQTEINAFFSSPDVAAFKELYGIGPTQALEEGFFDNRLRVMEQADQIRVGASYQGRVVGLTEALSLAHDSVSADHRTQAIREDIKNKVQKRAQSMTTRPAKGSESGSVSAPAKRTEKTREELIAYANEALRKVF